MLLTYGMTDKRINTKQNKKGIIFRSQETESVKKERSWFFDRSIDSAPKVTRRKAE